MAGSKEGAKTSRRRMHGNGEQAIGGLVHSDTGEPLAGALVTVYADDPAEPEEVGQATTDDSGAFSIDLGRTEHHACDLRVAVTDLDGRVLVAPDETTVHLDGASIGLDLSIPPRALLPKEELAPTIQLGPLRADAITVAEAEPELALDVARSLLGEKIGADSRKRLQRHARTDTAPPPGSQTDHSEPGIGPW